MKISETAVLGEIPAVSHCRFSKVVDVADSNNFNLIPIIVEIIFGMYLPEVGASGAAVSYFIGISQTKLANKREIEKSFFIFVP